MGDGQKAQTAVRMGPPELCDAVADPPLQTKPTEAGLASGVWPPASSPPLTPVGLGSSIASSPRVLHT